MPFFYFRKKAFSLVIVLIIVGFIFSNVYADSVGELTINYIESKPAENLLAHEVEATFSFLDSMGNPIKDLKIDDISISEDGQGVTPTSLDLVSDQSIYISLLLDTSGSMTGSRNEAAVAAATQFVSGLNKEDRISVTTFNSEISKLIDFSTDHDAVNNLIASIEAVPKSGTCLFDAAYKAVQETAAMPLGRRAVIILTDGKDESPVGGPCSKLTIDDVIDIASRGNTRVPIFTIGLGDTIDESGLMRISTLTGGRYEKTPDADQLENSFTRLLDLLQSQYILNFTSNAALGNHTLAIKINYLNNNFSDTRDFVLQELPLSLTIVSPTNGQEISETVKITAIINGHGDPIEQVVFSINDVVIGTDDITPYELEWNPETAQKGEAVITVKAIGSDKTELAVSTVEVTINSEEIVVSNNNEENTNLFSELFSEKNLPITLAVLGGLVILIIVIVILAKAKKKKETKNRNDQWNKGGGGQVDVSP